MSNPRYPEEFKIQAVNQVTEKKLPVADVAARLGVSTHSLYAWIKRYSKPQAERQQDDDQHAELRRLRAELKRVTEERDILKNRLPGAPRPIGLETLRSTLILLDSGRWLFGGLVPVKKLDPGEAADPLVVARSVTPFRKVI
ncbi:hypothetical protein PsexTeo8_52440 [Pseudomonas extremaustralis]|nr:hypothetical protein [Pseudomonas extremaustralis]